MDENSIVSVPSAAKDLLIELNGKIVAKLVRYSWWPPSQVGSECGIKDRMAFSLTAGPFAIYFTDGTILGVGSDSSLNSVIVWDEASAERKNIGTLADDSELFAISHIGEFATSFWGQFSGLPVTGTSILKREDMNAKQRSRPSEVGLRFSFPRGKSFIASHGLHDGTDDFSVIGESQMQKFPLQEIPIS